jgi:hypothetical protein
MGLGIMMPDGVKIDYNMLLISEANDANLDKSAYVQVNAQSKRSRRIFRTTIFDQTNSTIHRWSTGN